jgi:nitrate/nitrite-specific signal transduction histidine kinase
VSPRKTTTRILAGALVMSWILLAVWVGMMWIEQRQVVMPLAALCAGAGAAWKFGCHAWMGDDGP